MAASTQDLVEKRTMIVAGQHETVRKYPEQDLFLATIGLVNCVAVILANKSGMVSLTHVDSHTDLSFIADELVLTGDDSQVYMIKNPTMTGDLDKVVLNVIKVTGNVPEIKESSEGTVVFNHRRSVPQVFLMKDFAGLFTPDQSVSSTNRLKELGYSVECCVDDPLIFQLGTYTRQLNQALDDSLLDKPLLVHSRDGWIETDVDLTELAKKKIEIFEKTRRLRHADDISQKTFEYVYPKYCQLLEISQSNLSMTLK